MSEPEASPDSFTAGFPRDGDPGPELAALKNGVLPEPRFYLHHKGLGSNLV